jgi:hypothetical protein
MPSYLSSTGLPQKSVINANLASRVTANLYVVLKENEGWDYGNTKLTSNPIWVFLGIDRDPLLNTVSKLLLEIFEGRLDDLARSAGR